MCKLGDDAGSGPALTRFGQDLVTPGDDVAGDPGYLGGRVFNFFFFSVFIFSSGFEIIMQCPVLARKVYVLGWLQSVPGFICAKAWCSRT